MQEALTGAFERGAPVKGFEFGENLLLFLLLLLPRGLRFSFTALAWSVVLEGMLPFEQPKGWTQQQNVMIG